MFTRFQSRPHKHFVKYVLLPTWIMGLHYEKYHTDQDIDEVGQNYPAFKLLNTLTRWPPFSRRHFEMDFLEWKCVKFASDFNEICS